MGPKWSDNIPIDEVDVDRSQSSRDCCKGGLSRMHTRSQSDLCYSRILSTGITSLYSIPFSIPLTRILDNSAVQSRQRQ